MNNATRLMKTHNYAIGILKNFELIARNNCARWEKHKKETTMARGKFELYNIQQTQLESAIKRLEGE